MHLSFLFTPKSPTEYENLAKLNYSFLLPYFFFSREPEVQIMDYQTQQQKLFPAVATAYAFNAVFRRMMSLYDKCNDQIQIGDFSLLPEVKHAN